MPSPEVERAEDQLQVGDVADIAVAPAITESSAGLDSHNIAAGAKALAVAQIANQVMRFGTNIVLAHLLVPREFGVVAVALVVMVLLEQFRDMGTGVAVIQRRELSQDLLNAVFFVNVALGVLLGLILLTLAGPITGVVSHQGDPNVLRAFSVVTLVTALGQIHHALLRRELRFKALAAVTVADTIVSGTVSITLAALGLGPWALVIGAMAGSVNDTVMVWIMDRWRPTAQLALRSLRSIAAFSGHLFGTNLLWFFSNEIDKVLIGRYLGVAPLGVYGMANRILTYPLGSVATVASEVTFPTFAKHQDDDVVLRDAYSRVNAIVALITFPLMAVMAAVARPAVATVLGPQWASLTPLIWILAPVGALQSITQTSYQLLMAKGDTSLLFRWTLFSTAITATSYVIGLQWGLIGVCAAFAIGTCLLIPLNLVIMFRKIGLGMADYFGPILPIALSAVAAAGAVLGFGVLVPISSSALALIVQLAVGAVVFAAGMALLRPPVLNDARMALRQRRQGAPAGA